MSQSRTIWIFTLIIIAIGLVALYSASYENVRVSQQVFYDQLRCAGFGILVMYLTSRLHYRLFFDIAYPLYAVNVVLLLIVFFAGHSALGATRWFNVFGISFQPSELSKVAIILMLGRYYSTRNPKLSFDFMSTFRALKRDLLYPLFLMLLSFGLIFKQPDLGSALMVFGIFIVMLFMSGIGMKSFLGFVAACVALVPIGWHFLRDYQRDRLLVFLNPNADPLGAGYTIIQSRIAVGSGGAAGKGWLAGTQNQLNFLPERHTDFIFSVIGEEWGFLGSIVLVGCYFALIYTGLQIAQRTKDRFGNFVTVGIVSILTLQVVINVSMTLGLSPVVGITLPLVSWGRTSFMVFMIMLGILLNFSQRKSFGA